MKNLSKRIKHISHNGIDGHGCTSLTEFIVEAYPEGMFELETQNIVPNHLFGTIKKMINEIHNYDLIIITDLTITKDIADLIENSTYSNKFIFIDHHPTVIDVNQYQWLHVNIYEQQNGQDTDIQASATKLYYEFLKKDFIFDINLLHLSSFDPIEFFIECVTAWDTKTFNKKDAPASKLLGKVWEDVQYIAPRLNTLFHAVDKDEFKSYIKDYISNVDFAKNRSTVGIDPNKNIIFSEYNNNNSWYSLLTKSTEKYPWMDKIIEIEEKKNMKYIESALKKINIISLNKDFFKNGVIHNINCAVGLIFAERNGSDIGELANIRYPEIDFCAVVSNNQVTLYTTKDDVNVGEIASLLGGGGHRKAAGFSIDHTNSQWFNKAHFMAMFNCAANIAIPTK